jgi:hypothetical protein
MEKEELIDKFADACFERESTGSTPENWITLHDELLRRLEAAVLASPQPRCPKCGGKVELKRAGSMDQPDVLCAVTCSNCDPTWWGIRNWDHLLEFFAPAPAQEPPYSRPECHLKACESAEECKRKGICKFHYREAVAAQPVENSSRWCKDGGCFQCTDANCKCSCHTQPISGGASTPRENYERAHAAFVSEQVEKIGGASIGEQPRPCVWGEAGYPCNCPPVEASRPSGPSAQCSWPFEGVCQGDYAEAGACLKANRCLKNLPTAPKVEPWCEECQTIYSAEDAYIHKNHKRERPTQTTETASVPQQTRFEDFDDPGHPANKWWREHGEYMLSGGGRREFIWACRGWIAREQLAEGVEVTGDSLHEMKAPAQEPPYSRPECHLKHLPGAPAQPGPEEKK